MKGNSGYNGPGHGNSSMNGPTGGNSGPTSTGNIMDAPLNWVDPLWDGVTGPAHGSAV
jgi:hypothetical protein